MVSKGYFRSIGGEAMRCPNCDGEFLLGQDVCDACGTDLTYLSVPGPKRGRLHKLILKDPLSQLNLPEPVTLLENDSVAEAVHQMREHRYGSVLVLDGEGKLSGIFTEKDVLSRIQVGEQCLKEVRLAEVMTPNPHSLQEGDTIALALNHMSVGGYRHIPIVRDGRPVGFCSIRGILRYIAENALG